MPVGFLCSTAALMAVLFSGAPQPPTPTVARARYITFRLTTTPDAVAPGGKVAVAIEVRPESGMRVYAPGAGQFTPVTLAVRKGHLFALDKPKYDVPDRSLTPGTNRRVPMYAQAFRIVQTLKISTAAKPGTAIDVLGQLTYQTCDRAVVYPKYQLPLRWVVRIKDASENPSE